MRRHRTFLGVAAALYVAGVLLFAMGFHLRGVLEYDRTGRVTVEEGSAAARSGMISGDRIVAVGGVDVAGFDDIKPALRNKADNPLAVVVERDGARKEIGVQRAVGQKLGVGMPVVRSQVGAAAIAIRSLAEPGAVWSRTFRHRELSLVIAPDADGAVSFAEFLRPREHGDTVVSAGVLASYLIPVPALIALALVLRRRYAFRAA
jgi:membrane-associated protease RseP (regulator of RpoE activity)